MLDDPRNSLVREFVRIVDELRPSYFVFENVKGLTIGDHRALLDELIEEFARVHYRTRLPWRVLDAAEFGVPQHRERLILMGAKEGLRLPEYPAARIVACSPRDPPARKRWAIFRTPRSSLTLPTQMKRERTRGDVRVAMRRKCGV
jgi:DNA (cytosine-5)-methyltransferase 1